MDEFDKRNNYGAGIIPDFFHDVIAYLIPGYLLVSLVYLNALIVHNEYSLKEPDIGIVTFFVITIFAYILGRFLEQVGYKIFHRNIFVKIKPKWSLIFDESDDSYTRAFKDNLKTKVEQFLINQNGTELISECKAKEKDDYFNLIQFYLRERFPTVALYEKKQNATIVLMRSLTVAFCLNIFLYLVTAWLMVDIANLEFSLNAVVWLMLNAIFAFVFYLRFRLDQKYHAMYIFETFIATKKLLRKTTHG